MRLFAALFSLLFTLLTVQAFAKAPECEGLVRSVISVATQGRADGAKLIGAAQMSVMNEASASNEIVERLVFTTGASEIVVDALPSYYSKGQCEIKSVNINRE